MDFKEYQEKALVTATVLPSYGESGYDLALARYTLGIVDEGGEVAGKVKKWIRGDNPDFDTFRTDMLKEMGDVLWYIATVAAMLDIDMEDIATANIEKLLSRFERGVIKGSGDNR